MELQIPKIITEAFSRYGWTGRELARRAGTTNTTITALKQGRRAAPETITALIKCWPDPETGLSIAVAYLADERTRIGLTADQIAIAAIGDSLPDNNLLADFEELTAFMRDVPDFREGMAQVASLLRLYRQSKENEFASQVDVRAKVIAGKMGKKRKKETA